MDPYTELNVPKDSDARTIRKAYMRLAKKHHPDVGGDTKIFAKVSRAYEILSCPAKRDYWDRTGEEAKAEGSVSAEAEQLISSLTMELISQLGDKIIYTDVMSSLMSKLSSRKLEGSNALEANKKSLAKLELVVDRFKPTDSAPARVIRQEIQKIEGMNEQCKHVIAVAEAAMDKAEGITFDKDEQPVQSFTTTFTSTSTGSGW